MWKWKCFFFQDFSSFNIHQISYHLISVLEFFRKVLRKKQLKNNQTIIKFEKIHTLILFLNWWNVKIQHNLITRNTAQQQDMVLLSLEQACREDRRMVFLLLHCYLSFSLSPFFIFLCVCVCLMLFFWCQSSPCLLVCSLILETENDASESK